MIHIFIGTKAQYIKTAPVIRRLERLGIPFNLIDSGQHAHILYTLRKELKVRDPDVSLRQGSDISSFFAGCAWLLKWLAVLVCAPRKMRRDLFKNRKGVCLVHGDTGTTLLSAVMAKRAGLDLAHLEAGLRSYNWLHPFPEEIVRLIVTRLSDHLFAPGQWAFDNLERMNLKGRVVNVGMNTGAEAVRYARENAVSAKVAFDEYILVTLHRMETIRNRRRMRWFADLVQRMAAKNNVVFISHPATTGMLRAYGLYDRLAGKESIQIMSLQPHGTFIKLSLNSIFVATDGGSVQEECAYLKIPCLLLRKKTERGEGLGENVVLSRMEDRIIDEFISREYSGKREPPDIETFTPPSEIVVDALEEYRGTK